MKLKLFILTICVPVLFSGCFGKTEVSLNLYQGENFTIGMLENWQSVERNEFPPSIPKEALVAFLSSDTTININLVREFLNGMVSSLEYANANILVAGDVLLDYDKVSIEDVSINDQPTRLHVFKGRPSKSDLLLKYLQVYIVKDNVGYTITGTLYVDSTVEEVNTMRDVLLSFSFNQLENSE